MSLAVDALIDKNLLASSAKLFADISWPAVLSAAAQAAAGLRDPARRVAALRAMIERLELRAGRITLRLSLQVGAHRLPLATTRPLALKRRGAELRLIIDGPTAASQPQDLTLVRGIARGHQWLHKLTSGQVASIAELARNEKVSARYISRLMRLAFLSPEITASALSGTHAPTLTLQLLLTRPIALEWAAQQRAVNLPLVILKQTFVFPGTNEVNGQEPDHGPAGKRRLSMERIISA